MVSFLFQYCVDNNKSIKGDDYQLYIYLRAGPSPSSKNASRNSLDKYCAFDQYDLIKSFKSTQANKKAGFNEVKKLRSILMSAQLLYQAL